MLLLGFVLSDDIESGDVTSICWCGVVLFGVSVLFTGVNLADRCFFVSVGSGGIVFGCIFFVLGHEWLMRVISFCCYYFLPS